MASHFQYSCLEELHEQYEKEQKRYDTEKLTPMLEGAQCATGEE